MRKYIEPLLVKFPALYRAILRYRRRADYNVDKVIFLATINADEIVVDVGAYKGYYTLLFSNIVGKGGQVHAFEPIPPTFGKLSEFVHKGQLYNNVFLKNLALSDVAGRTVMYTPGVHEGHSSMEVHAYGSWLSNAEIVSWDVVTSTLDIYVKERAINRLQFLKIDTEGAELLVLNGARETIERFRPLIYVAMFNQWFKDFNYSGTEIAQLLQSLGYDTFHLITDVIEPLDSPALELSAETLTKPANLLCSIAALHGERVEKLPVHGVALSSGDMGRRDL